jgi:hypothetical protein
MLRSPDFSKYFFLYTFSFDQSLVAGLNQKDDYNNEAPVSFMRTNLQGVELNYPSIDKQDYAVYKAVKHFRYYILKNHTKVIVLTLQSDPYSLNKIWGKEEETGWK